MYLNGGIDPKTNATIISSTQLDFITSGHSIVSGGSPTVVYGAGWQRLSALGHDVSESCPLHPTSDIILAISSSCTVDLQRGSPHS
jgi:hypothetical protein